MALSMEWAFPQLTKVYKQQPELVETAVQQMLQATPDLTWSLVISAYQDEDINLGKAASLLGLHELELRDQFIKLGIPLRIGPATIAEAHAEVQAMDSWFVEGMTLSERMEVLIRSGFATWNGGRLSADMPTIKTKGDKTISQLVIEDRE